MSRSDPSPFQRLALLSLVLTVTIVPAAEDPRAVLDALETSTLDPGAAVHVENLRLDTGLARLFIRDGRLYPASPVAGRPVEFVLIGDAIFEVDPPDPIEADQLERFTGDTRMREPVTEAVLVVCMDAAADALADPARRVETPDAEEIARARELYGAWRTSQERTIVAARGAVVQDALGDPYYATYFAGRFDGEELGTFLYLVEPDAREQVTLGQFVRPELSDKEKRRSDKRLHRQQRQGRMLGFETDDLGRFDNWLSTSLVGTGGEPTPGVAAFEPTHYALDVRVDGRDERIEGTATIRLRAVTGSRPVARFEMDSDLRVERAHDADGEELPFVQERGVTYVALTEAPAQGDEIELTLEYAGTALRKIEGVDRMFALEDTTGWYPHAGHVDRATYDLTLRWPKRFDLTASGSEVTSGTDEEGERWTHRRLDVPASAVSFELGKFELESFRVGDVRVTVAFDRVAQDMLLDTRKEVVDTIRDVLEYYQETFGPYPLAELQVTTSPRSFSQGLLGFVTVSTVYMLDAEYDPVLRGLEDRRTILAHEIAHQWWGGLVGWRDYRDQWLSEAMANYATLMWIKHRLPPEKKPPWSPISQWTRILGLSTDDGRSIEQVGPLVLGARLESSGAEGAYDAIVYRKGAVVLNMLAQNFDEPNFLAANRKICEIARFRPISTPEYLDALETMFRTELDWFADQFVYGTGLPEVYYRYEIVPGDDGSWTLRASLEQQTPFRYKDRVVRLEDGRLDVRTEYAGTLDTGNFTLVVPIAIGFHDPTADGGRKKRGRKRDREPEPNRWMLGRIRLAEAAQEFEIPVDFEPLDFELDRDDAVFGRFFNETRQPKRMKYYRGIDARNAGDLPRAEALFREALATEFRGGEVDDRSVARHGTRRLDYDIRLSMVGLLLDQDRLDEASGMLDGARGAVGGLLGGARNDTTFRFLEARLALLRGQHEDAFQVVERQLDRRRPMDRVTGNLLLAVAARALGRDEVAARSIEYARERGADVGALGDGGS
jgi:hypothetical protein